MILVRHPHSLRMRGWLRVSIPVCALFASPRVGGRTYLEAGSRRVPVDCDWTPFFQLWCSVRRLATTTTTRELNPKYARRRRAGCVRVCVCVPARARYSFAILRECCFARGSWFPPVLLCRCSSRHMCPFIHRLCHLRQSLQWAVWWRTQTIGVCRRGMTHVLFLACIDFQTRFGVAGRCRSVRQIFRFACLFGYCF